MTTSVDSSKDQFDGAGNLILVVMISLLLATGSVILVIAEAQEEPEIPAARPDVGPGHRGLDEESRGAASAEPVPAIASGEPVSEPVSEPISESRDSSEARTPAPERVAVADESPAVSEPVAALEASEPGPAPGSPEEDAKPNLPSSVMVVESDRVNIGRALGGDVEFVPTTAFEQLEDEVRDPTFAISVEIRSKVVKTGAGVTINATGIWARITDTVRHVRLPAIKVDFEEGPFPRRVNRDDVMRPRLEPFNTALRLDAKSYVRRVEAAVRSALVKAKAKRGN